MFGATCINTVVPLGDVQPLTRENIEDAIREGPGSDEDVHLIQYCSDMALQRLLTCILQFLGYEGRISGTMGNPVTDLPYSMHVVKDLLESLNIQNFGHYLVIPYSDYHLRVKAMADYLYVTAQWE